MEKASMQQTIAYLQAEKERLQSVYREWIEDMDTKRKAIYNILDRCPVDSYTEFENYVAYVDSLKKFLEEQLQSIEKWELPKVFMEGYQREES